MPWFWSQKKKKKLASLDFEMSPSAGDEAQEGSHPAVLRMTDNRDTVDPLATRIEAANEAKAAAATADASLLANVVPQPPQPPLLSRSQQKKELRRARSAQLRAEKKAFQKAQTVQLKADKMEEVRARIQAMTAEERREWEAVRGARRAERREQAAAKKERLRRALEGGGEEGGEGGSGNPSAPCFLKVIIDCGYSDGMMTLSEARSLAGQLARCVGSNARARNPARLSFAGIPPPPGSSSSSSSASSAAFSSTSRLIFERLANISGHERWPVRWMRSLEEEAAVAGKGGSDNSAAADAAAAAACSSSPNRSSIRSIIISSKKIVYLSADAEEELSESLDPRTTFVIGGLVDRNRHRGAARSRAASLNIETARLPLQSLGGAVLNSSAVLTVDQTFALLLAAVNAGGGGGGVGRQGGEEGEGERTTAAKPKPTTIRADWAAGVRAAVPSRKMARPQEQEQEQEQRAVSGAPEA